MEPHRYYDLLYSRLYGLPLLGPSSRARRAVVQRLELPPGSNVFVPGCGAGADLPFIVELVGAQGRVVGLDYSERMLHRAKERVERSGWRNVVLIREDARRMSRALLEEHVELSEADGLLFSLVLSVVPDWEQVFERSFALLRAGGRCVVWDTKTAEGWLRFLNPIWFLYNRLTAAADTYRPTWKLLDGRVSDLRVNFFLGGLAFVASGTKT